MSAPSETAKYRHLTIQYCTGCGIDVGAGSEPIAPHAISVDLPDEEYRVYNGSFSDTVHLRGHAHRLFWFRDSVLDFVYSSHLIEDFEDAKPLLREWVRVVRPGGHIVIVVPDKSLWEKALSRGQPPNCAHKHEYRVGELTEVFEAIGCVETIVDRLTALDERDYSILYVGKKR